MNIDKYKTALSILAIILVAFFFRRFIESDYVFGFLLFFLTGMGLLIRSTNTKMKQVQDGLSHREEEKKKLQQIITSLKEKGEVDLKEHDIKEEDTD